MTPNAEMLETLLDRMGLKGTVELLAILCEEKGDHVASNWQDMTLAKGWYRDAKHLDAAAASWRTRPAPSSKCGGGFSLPFSLLGLTLQILFKIVGPPLV